MDQLGEYKEINLPNYIVWSKAACMQILFSRVKQQYIQRNLTKKSVSIRAQKTRGMLFWGTTCSSLAFQFCPGSVFFSFIGSCVVVSVTSSPGVASPESDFAEEWAIENPIFRQRKKRTRLGLPGKFTTYRLITPPHVRLTPRTRMTHVLVRLSIYSHYQSQRGRIDKSQLVMRNVGMSLPRIINFLFREEITQIWTFGECWPNELHTA